MVKKRRWRGSFSDKTFDLVNVIVMILLLFLFVYPLYYVLISSFSDPAEIWSGNVTFWPREVTLIGYKRLFEYSAIWTGYRNTIFYTVVGTAVNMVMSVLCAYPLSRKEWLPRKFFMTMCLAAMYFNGGLIPTYLVVKKLRLVNTVWAMILPSALSFYNVLIIRNYFMSSIPGELQEAAELDGASTAQYLMRVVLPLSKPVLAVVALYYAVWHWNDYYTALIYLYDRELVPLQTVLREVLSAVSSISADTSIDVASLADRARLAQNLKFTSIVVSIIPMLAVYPMIQKHFVKGVMVGAIKG